MEGGGTDDVTTKVRRRTNKDSFSHNGECTTEKHLEEEWRVDGATEDSEVQLKMYVREKSAGIWRGECKEGQSKVHLRLGVEVEMWSRMSAEGQSIKSLSTLSAVVVPRMRAEETPTF